MKIREPEKEHTGSIWTHPYMVYIILTMILFGGLVFAGYLAIKNGWLPNQS
jgi:hypothetical protein